MSERALEALQELILTGWCRDGWPHLGPGKVLAKAKPENRELLKMLTSDDVCNVRLDSIGFQEPRRKGRWGL